MLLLSYYFVFASIRSNSNLTVYMNSCVFVGGIIRSAFMKRFLKYLNFGAIDRNRNDCGDIEDFKIISLLSGDATMYDLINNEESSLKYGIYMVALCNLIQEIEESLDLDDGEYVTFSLTPNTASGSGGVFCDSPLAFGFGLYSIQIQLICDDQLYGFIPTFRVPFRSTFGLIADSFKEHDWAIQHYHESINFEAIFGNLIQDILELPELQPANASDGVAPEFYLERQNQNPRERARS